MDEKGKRGWGWMVPLVLAALVLGLMVGRLLAPRTTVRTELPGAVYVVNALEVAWEATWEGGTPPPATVAEGDQRVCWHVGAFDYGQLEAWRCLARDGTPLWAWYPADEAGGPGGEGR